MNDDNQAANSDRESTTSSATTWRSEELLRGAKEVLILHEGQLYRLRCTRNGKLILQK